MTPFGYVIGNGVGENDLAFLDKVDPLAVVRTLKNYENCQVREHRSNVHDCVHDLERKFKAAPKTERRVE